MNGFPSNWTTEEFATSEEAFDQVTNLQNQPFCFAVDFKKFDNDTNEYDIQFSFNKQDVPDTNLAAYNELVKAPDFANWNLWFTSGATSMYPVMTEFIARYKAGLPMTLGLPPLITTVGYAPM